MGGLEGLYTMMAGQKIMGGMDKAREDQQKLASLLGLQAAQAANLGRENPTLTDQGNQLNQMNPDALAKLFQLKGQAGDSSLDEDLKRSMINKNNQDALKKKNQDKKLEETQGYAATLNDQLNALSQDVSKIPGHMFGGLGLTKLFGNTGQASYTGAQSDFASRRIPITDTYVKMTAGRANKEILSKMFDDLEQAQYSPDSVRLPKIAALKDFLNSEYYNTAIAHGADPDALPSLDSLSSKARNAMNKSGISSASGGGDNEAVTWAKQNPSDPRAAKILQLNGAQ